MRSRPDPVVPRLRRGTAVVASAVLGLSIVAAPANAEPAATLPGLPSLMDLPGAGQLTGGKDFKMGADGRTNINLPAVPTGGIRKQFTNAPAVEQSTRPACAPFVFVGVPGTFEINRDDPTTKPIGMLAKITDPLSKQLGNKFVATMVNYDADAGVNGTSYKTSVDRGLKKTLATVTDVANRCPKTSIIIGGYSQGAAIAGSAATAIGQKRTPVNPARIGGVVLVSDPQRTPNSNVIADTTQSRPDMPAFLANVVGQLANDPSFAQLQMDVTNGVGNLLSGAAPGLNDLTKKLAGGDGTTGLAGQPQPTQAPASTTPSAPAPFTTDDPSVEPDAPATSLAPGPTSPGLAGSYDGSRGAVIVPVEGPQQGLASAVDDLQDVKPTDNDKPAPPEGVTSIGNKDTQEWVPLSELKTIGDFTEKTKGGWVYGRTPAQKEDRRKVVDDLFLNGWDQCKGKTLSWCRGNYVYGLPNNEKATGLFTASAELTSTRDALVKNKSYVRPADNLIDSCLENQQSACASKVNGLAKRSQQYEGRDVDTLPGRRIDNNTNKAESKIAPILAAVTGYKDDSGTSRPITALFEQTKGRIIEGSDHSFCAADDGLIEKMKESAPGGKLEPGGETLAKAWDRGTGAGKGNDHVDLKQDDAGLAKQIKGFYPDADAQKCAAWAVATYKAFQSYYDTGRLEYREGYTAPNDPLKNDDKAKRQKLVGELYWYGGCGTPVDGETRTVAPNGEWSPEGCLAFHTPDGSGAGRKSEQLTHMQLQQLVKDSKGAYAAAKPDWDANILVTAADSKQKLALDPALRAYGCKDLSARTCSIIMTRISGPDSDQPPAGVTKMIKPIYPTASATLPGQPPTALDWGAPSPAEPVDPKGKAADLRKDGHLWATAEVVAAVKKLDDVRIASIGRKVSPTKPDGVATMINTTTGAETKPKDEKTATAMLGQGWVWGRTGDENRKRMEIVTGLYNYGEESCKGTYVECRDQYTRAGRPKYALSNEALTALLSPVKDNVEQGRITLDYKIEDLPNAQKDVDAKCGDKTAVECAGGQKPKADDEPADDDAPAAAGEDDDAPADDDSDAPADDDAPADSGSDDDSSAPADDDSGTPADDDSSADDDSGTPADDGAPDDSGSDDDSAGTDDSGTSPGAAGATTSAPALAGGDEDDSPTTDSDADGGLANDLTNLLTSNGGTTQTVGDTGSSGEKANVSPITQKAVAGGGLEGKRDADFGALKGRVVSLCVPGDIVCSLPENSELAQDLVKFAKNLSLNFPDMASEEGATRMGGLLALQGLNSISDITGMPKSKLSADTLQALINLAAGAGMLAAQQPGGATLVADGVAKLPDAMPEIFSQIADVPELLRSLSTAPQTTMDNTGLGKLLGRVTAAFEGAGMTSPLDVQKYPDAANAMMQGLIEDNTGLIEMVTNPQYWKANAHVLYPSLKISGNTGSLNWVAEWFSVLARAAGLR